MDGPRLSVIVPVYNEVGTVRTLLERVMAVRLPKEIIVVDDCSTDGTRTVLEELRAATPDTPANRLVLLFQAHNQGKGAAVRAAVPHMSGDIAIIQDADLEYDPAEYPRLIQPILDGHADVVYGSPDIGREDEGFTTLRRVEALRRYTEFQWELMRPYVGRRVLEVGSGTGVMTQYLATHEHVVATEFDPEYLELLQRRYAGKPNVEVRALDLAQVSLDGFAPGSFDTVTCARLLEHLRDDEAALRAMRAVLAPGGRVVLIVPALPALYGTIDRAIGQHRRYTRTELVRKLRGAGLAVEHVSYFNMLGVAGWFLNARILGRRTVPGLQARLNDRLVPLLRLERRLSPPIGMPLLAVGRAGP